MKFSRLCPIVLFGVTNFAAAAIGQPANVASYYLAVRMNGPIVDLRQVSGFSSTFDYSLASVDKELQFKSQDIINLPSSNASGVVSGTATAQTAALGISVTGGAVAVENDISGIGRVLVEGKADASWEDIVTLNYPSAAVDEVTVHAFMILDGSFSYNFLGSATPGVDPVNGLVGTGAYAQYYLTIAGTGVLPGPYAPYYGYAFDDLTHLSPNLQVPPLEALVTYKVKNGETKSINYVMSLDARARALSNAVSGSPGGTVSAFFAADYIGTLKWGGITGVFDSVTGARLEGWTITSQSGFDYSRPFGVPEPSSLAFLCMCLFALSVVRHRGLDQQ